MKLSSSYHFIYNKMKVLYIKEIKRKKEKKKKILIVQ